MVNQITLSGAINLCKAISESESNRSEDFKQIVAWLRELQEFKKIMNDAAFAKITKGKWENPGNLSIFKCDVCDEASSMMSQFCPHCGSFMTNGK